MTLLVQQPPAMFTSAMRKASGICLTAGYANIREIHPLLWLVKTYQSKSGIERRISVNDGHLHRLKKLGSIKVCRSLENNGE